MYNKEVLKGMNVWYVSYGSNINLERFMCYINGTKPEGSNKKEKGCRDKTPPKAINSVVLPYQLYFSKERSKWGEGGVAFINYIEDFRCSTLGRMYLITDQQFCDVVAQENNTKEMLIDLQKVINHKYSIINDGWYGRILFLGYKDGAPMFTFTNNQLYKNITINKPHSSYLKTITKGLLEIGLGLDEIIDYFLKQPGIREYFTKEKLFKYIT